MGKTIDKAEKKADYFSKLVDLLTNHHQILIVKCDNVGSNQMQNIRRALRGQAIVLMGKNTMIRKVIRGQITAMPQLERLLPAVKENVGFIFCKGDLGKIREVITGNRVPAAAKAGTIAPVDVTVPAGATGLDPSQTSFFQALNIATKINKGQIEIINNVNLITKGTKVGNSEVALLNKLDIKPFSYGLVLNTVYDNGSVYDPEVLSLTNEVVLEKFFNGVQNVAALSRSVGIPTAAALPHILIDGFKNIIGAVLESDYSFKQLDNIRNALKNPGASAPAPAAVAAPAAAAAPAPKKVEEEEDADMGMGLFGDD